MLGFRVTTHFDFTNLGVHSKTFSSFTSLLPKTARINKTNNVTAIKLAYSQGAQLYVLLTYFYIMFIW